MPTSGSSFAADTSVAVAALDSGHAAHRACRERIVATRAALAGHAAFETYSVLTRMPGQFRVDGPDALTVLETSFPEQCWLSPAAARELLQRLGPLGIVGGATYDAMVGQAALLNGKTLLTRDGRALRTYDLLGVRYEFI